MFDITIVAFGGVKEKHFLAACEEYLIRLRPYAKIKIEELKPESFSKSNREAAKKEEANRLLHYLDKRKGAEVFLLAEKGEEYDSAAFSKRLESISGSMILIIGSAQGFADEIFNAYPKLSLSKLTFPHELARVVLLEQIYRAVTILNKKEYHY